jgi:hypothetical protein
VRHLQATVIIKTPAGTANAVTICLFMRPLLKTLKRRCSLSLNGSCFNDPAVRNRIGGSRRKRRNDAPASPGLADRILARLFRLPGFLAMSRFKLCLVQARPCHGALRLPRAQLSRTDLRQSRSQTENAIGMQNGIAARRPRCFLRTSRQDNMPVHGAANARDR